MNNQTEDKKSLFVGEGVTLEGKINTSGAVEVHGVVIGDVVAHSVQIGPGGRVEGSVSSSTLDISGSVSSSINVEDKLVLRASGIVEGDITYGTMQVDAGATVFGSLRQNKMPEQKPDSAAAASGEATEASATDTESSSV